MKGERGEDPPSLPPVKIVVECNVSHAYTPLRTSCVGVGVGVGVGRGGGGGGGVDEHIRQAKVTCCISKRAKRAHVKVSP